MLKCKYCGKTYPSNEEETSVNFEKYKQGIINWMPCDKTVYFIDGIGIVCSVCYDKHIKDKYIEASSEKNK
jgi:hypothetical protein